MGDEVNHMFQPEDGLNEMSMEKDLHKLKFIKKEDPRNLLLNMTKVTKRCTSIHFLILIKWHILLGLGNSTILIHWQPRSDRVVEMNNVVVRPRNSFSA